jgi:2-aminoadipate transaminase
MDIMEDLVARVLKKYGSGALQYDLTEGFPPLREALTGLLAGRGISVNPRDVFVTTGSQGFLDGIAKILISPGDKIALEAPTYLGAIQAFNPYEPEYVSMDTDEDGLIPESLEEVLAKHSIKFIYLVPTFQNPTGRTIPLERRRRIAEIVREKNALLVEDDPYGMLRYRGSDIPSIRTMAPDNTVYTSTLSKVFAPGLRVGFVIAPPPVDRWLILGKQGVDLHTSTFNQALAAEYIAGGHLERQLPKILNIYRPKQEAMLGAMEKYFPESFSWSKPDGGMFIWAEGPHGMDMEKEYPRAIERKVAYVPGKFFYTRKGEGDGTMRLNFTMADVPTLEGAIKTLGEVLAIGTAKL